ncbi:MAG: signal peptide peptidase SppA [Beijerinckiaceae bacterium]|nr:signal peptide peptidase SppA [Beijerinckiaceae bacterium]
MADVIADHIIDRSRLRRKLTFWRVVSVIAVVAAIGAVGWRFTKGSVAPSDRHVARVSISGLITGDRETLRLIDNIAKSQAAAVVVNIESPGGTTTGAEKVYDELRRLAEKKPVVAVINSTGASGAYIAALGADHIVAHGNSLVGSIGVLFQYPNLARAMNTLGVKMEEIKSSPLKAAPNPFEDATPEARAALASLVTDSYDWFRDLVRERRNLSDAELNVVADGRVFTGRQAIKVKLIDQLGTERDAIAWLQKEKNISADLPVRDWRRPSTTGRWGIFSLSSLADAGGFPAIGALLRQAEVKAEAGSLDGLLALWHGRLSID